MFIILLLQAKMLILQKKAFRKWVKRCNSACTELRLYQSKHLHEIVIKCMRWPICLLQTLYYSCYNYAVCHYEEEDFKWHLSIL